MHARSSGRIWFGQRDAGGGADQSVSGAEASLEVDLAVANFSPELKPTRQLSNVVKRMNKRLEYLRLGTVVQCCFR